MRVYVRARHNDPPHLSDSAAIFLDAVPLRLLPFGRDRNDDLLIRWEAIVGLSYRLQYKTDLRQPNWTDWHFAVQASEDEPALWDLNPSGGPAQKYFRVTLEP